MILEVAIDCSSVIADFCKECWIYKRESYYIEFYRVCIVNRARLYTINTRYIRTYIVYNDKSIARENYHYKNLSLRNSVVRVCVLCAGDEWCIKMPEYRSLSTLRWSFTDTRSTFNLVVRWVYKYFYEIIHISWAFNCNRYFMIVDSWKIIFFLKFK